MENVQLQDFCLEGLQSLRFFLGTHVKWDLAKLSLESPHRHSRRPSANSSFVLLAAP